MSEWDGLTDLIKDFEFYFKLWDLSNEFEYEKKDWETGSFMKLSYQQIEKKIDSYWRDTNKLLKFFKDVQENANALQVATMLKEQLHVFKGEMWLIELLTTEALQKKPAYFKEVFKECDLPVMEPSDELTFE